MLVALSLAEMASAYPTTAGPLEWTFPLAPRKMAHFLVSIVMVVSGRLNVESQPTKCQLLRKRTF